MERFSKFIGMGLAGLAVLISAFACAQASVPQNPVSCTPVLAVKPDRLTFNVPLIPNAKSEQTISIINKGTGDLNWVMSDDSSWITLEHLTGTSTLQGTDARVIIDVTGMNPGNYTGIVTVTSEGALNTAVYVPILLSIQSSGVASQPAVQRTPAQLEQTMAPCVAIPTPSAVSTSEMPPVDSVYWKNQNDLYRYANSNACNVSGSIRNLDKIWYMGDVKVVTGSGSSAYIMDIIPPGEQISYNRYIPCFDRETVRLSYRWYRP